jgi:predicted DCC family thiol-disulfide oxidoreductase YuxK
MEVEFLRKRDIEGKIKYTDLNSPDYDPKEHGNVKFSEGMRKIRAVLPDNTVVSGVEVFRQVYSAIGLGWMFEMTNVPVIGRVADAMYDIWAENRCV